MANGELKKRNVEVAGSASGGEGRFKARPELEVEWGH